MNDEITERVLTDESENTDADKSSGPTGTFSRFQALSAVSTAIGVWALIGVTAGWGEPRFPTGTSPMGAIIATLMMTVLVIVSGEARRLPFFPDLRDGVWEILTLWGIVVIGAGALVGMVLWGPPALAEMLREAAT